MLVRVESGGKTGWLIPPTDLISNDTASHRVAIVYWDGGEISPAAISSLRWTGFGQAPESKKKEAVEVA